MMRFIVRQAWSKKGYNIWLVNDFECGSRFVKPFEMIFEDELKDNSYLLPEPTLFIRDIDFQSMRSSLINELEGSGIEPQAIAKASELKATKYHLEDLRKLVFEKSITAS